MKLKFTFQYGSIKSQTEKRCVLAEEIFTFQYGSIKSCSQYSKIGL